MFAFYDPRGTMYSRKLQIEDGTWPHMLQYDKTYRSICERNYQKNLENYGVRIFKISTANAGGGGGL